MPAAEIEAMIRAAIPDAEVSIRDLAGPSFSLKRAIDKCIIPGPRLIVTTRAIVARRS